jgi:nitrogen fixation protein FixH
MKSRPNLWPFGIITAFALFIAGTASLIVLACANRTDLVSADYYEQEIKFQGQMERVRRTQALGMPSRITYNAAAGRIVISVPGLQTTGSVSGRIQLYRPSAAGLDKSMRFSPDSQGFQSVDATKLAPGLWKVRVHWIVEHEEYFAEETLIIGNHAQVNPGAMQAVVVHPFQVATSK